MRILLFFILSILAQTINAQSCKSTILADAPNKRYILKNGMVGTVLDKQTGLTWMRCALGQTWRERWGCVGSPQLMPWQTALQKAERATFASLSDWRLPNQKELQSLVERRCYEPAINRAIFPGIASPAGARFWSSTPHIDNIGVWSVDFYLGEDINSNKVDKHAVRLVREDDE